MSNGKKNEIIEAMTPVGRFNYCYHDEVVQNKKPDGTPDGEPFYKVTVSWPKSMMAPDGALTEFRRKAMEAKKAKWGDRNVHLQPFLRDGDNPEHNTKDNPELHGHVYMTFKSKTKPGLIGPRNETILDVDVYSGCYGRVSCILFGTEYAGKNYVSVRLSNIQKSHDGERIGGKPDARSQFTPLVAATDDDDLMGSSGGSDDMIL